MSIEPPTRSRLGGAPAAARRARRQCVRVWLLITTLSAFACVPSAYAAPALQPGHEADILALLSPYADGALVVPGVVISGIEVAPTQIVVRLQNSAHEGAAVTLMPPAASSAATGPRGVVVRVSAVAQADLAMAEAALQRHLEGREFAPFAAREPPPAPPRRPITLPSAVPFAWPPATVPIVYACEILWLVLLIAMIRSAAALTTQLRLRQSSHWPLVGGTALTFLAALCSRLACAFWPLHANGHWTHDAALAMRLGGVATDAEANYGAAWVLLQQLGLRIFGADIEALGRLSTVVGALAAALTFVAGLSRTRSLTFAALGGGLIALAPFACRVGHSESPFAVAQLLFACALLLGCGQTTRWQIAGLGAAVALLALGHPLGPGFAASALLLAIAFAPHRAAGGIGRARALVLLATTGVASAIQGALVQTTLTHRLTDDWLPLLRFHPSLLLWTADAWLPWTGLAVALLGGLVCCRSWARDKEFWKIALFLLGFTLLVRVSSLVNACVSDGLRYQAVWAVPLGVLVASCGSLVTEAPEHWQRRAKVISALIGVTLFTQLLLPSPARAFLDSQGTAWQFLSRRPALAAERTAHFMTMDGVAGSRFLMGPPIGRWTANGPTSDVLSIDVARAFCERNGSLPPDTWIFFEPGCRSAAMDGCQALQAFAAEGGPSQEFDATRLPSTALHAEFHDFPRGPMAMRLTQARCPTTPQR